MKILSWNVNGIRAAIKNWFLDVINNYSPDVICIQEVKADKDQFLKSIWSINGYDYIWHSWITPGYAGTAIFYKTSCNIINKINTFSQQYSFWSDGRITQIEDENNIYINVYFPNGGMKQWKSMLEDKLQFLDNVSLYIQTLEKQNKNILLIWDLNIVHKDIDISHPKRNKNAISCLPEEKQFIDNLINNHYIDIYRHFYPEIEWIYSRWSYRVWAREKNMGKRIDYFLCNNDFVKQVKSIEYLREVDGSDHCPILLEYKNIK